MDTGTLFASGMGAPLDPIIVNLCRSGRYLPLALVLVGEIVGNVHSFVRNEVLDVRDVANSRSSPRCCDRKIPNYGPEIIGSGGRKHG